MSAPRSKLSWSSFCALACLMTKKKSGVRWGMVLEDSASEVKHDRW